MASKPSTRRTVQPPRTIPLSYLIKQFRILFQSWTINPQDRLTWSRRILQLCRTVFTSESLGTAFIYLCEHGAATAWLLQIQLGMTRSTSYQALNRLRALNIVEPVLKLPRRRLKRSGPIPRVWGLVGNYTEKEVAEAINLHYRCLSPKYRLAQEVAQSMLDRYIRPRRLREVSYREILIHIRELRVPFKASDVADLTAQYLSERGIKVWR